MCHHRAFLGQICALSENEGQCEELINVVYHSQVTVTSRQAKGHTCESSFCYVQKRSVLMKETRGSLIIRFVRPGNMVIVKLSFLLRAKVIFICNDFLSSAWFKNKQKSG